MFRAGAMGDAGLAVRDAGDIMGNWLRGGSTFEETMAEVVRLLSRATASAEARRFLVAARARSFLGAGDVARHRRAPIRR